LFVYFYKPAVLSRGYIFDGDNRSLIRRAADRKERKEVHEMRVVAVGGTTGLLRVGGYNHPNTGLNKGMANESRRLTRYSIG
jgi:hypothetical protein